MCGVGVALGGTQSLALYYNIRHAILHEIFTFSDIKFYEFEQLTEVNFYGII